MAEVKRRWWLRGAVTLLAIVLLMQLVPYGQAQINPPVSAEPHWNTAETRVLAKHACFDCHSNETVWPLYARIAPVSWLVSYDVTEGRRALNFSEWNRPQKEADEAAEKVRERDMPPAAYQWMHGSARLSDADRQRLADGLAATLGANHDRSERRD
jgi:hypothetical protein